MIKYGLALHTSSRDLGLAISNFAQDARWQSWGLDRDLSNYLHSYLGEFLRPQTWQELAFLAVAKGPGSFTSLRLGLVTARTLGQLLDIPVYTISSLAAFAYSQASTSPVNLALEMPASQGKIYGAIYQLPKRGQPPEVYLSDRLLTQTEWENIRSQIPFTYELLEVSDHLGDNVPSLLELAYFPWQRGEKAPWTEALPFYD